MVANQRVKGKKFTSLKR